MTAILVTGGNTGIGYALCKYLLFNTKYDVILGSRNVIKGEQAVTSILESIGAGEALIVRSRIKAVQLDVTDAKSVTNAAESLKHMIFYAVVNNAGTGFAHVGIDPQTIIQTNLFGVKRVTEAFLPLLFPQKNLPRIIMVASGAAPNYISNKTLLHSESGQILSSNESTWRTIGRVGFKISAPANR